jgi:hypothetical protein
MALEFLRDQQDKQNPDRGLLEELGWTPDDLRAFVERWQKLKQGAREDVKAQRELDDSLRSLGLGPTPDKRRTGSSRTDDVRGMGESGIKSAPPSSYQDQFDAFRKGAARGSSKN